MAYTSISRACFKRVSYSFGGSLHHVGVVGLADAADRPMPAIGVDHNLRDSSVVQQGAAQALYDATLPENAALQHLDQPMLNAAVEGARRRDLGDGGWTWARKATTVDLSPLVAVTLAAWGYSTRGHRGGLQLFTF